MSLYRRWFPARHRDEHLADRIGRMMLIAWLVVLAAGLVTGNVMLWIFALGVLVIVPLVQLISGRLAGNIYQPTGSSVKSRPSYSGPESLAVRGRFEEAIAAYEAAAAEEPDDPEPWLRIARMERSELKRPQRAIEALRAARSRATEGSATALLVAREIAEVLLRECGEPRRAMPELARLAAAHPDTPAGRWAAQELKELKERVAREDSA